ncbi:MAG: stage III sporulation protein AF [Clostridia bacterium]|nr:stage III sporulation protein AF [Clostridia bacterium]
MTLSSGAGALVMISVTAAIVSLMSPDGELKKYINLVSVLVVLAALAVPVAAALGNVPDMVTRIEEIDFDSAATGNFDAVTLSKAEIEKRTAEQIESRFSLARGSVGVDVTLDDSDRTAIDITRISVGVPRGTDREKVRKYVEELYKNTAQVTVYEVDDG